MDKVDLEIIKILADNGRITHEELGKRLHLSRPAVHQRVANAGFQIQSGSALLVGDIHFIYLYSEILYV